MRHKNKSCFPIQFRQSSTARAGSAQAGTTIGETPKALNEIRPRLKAIASSKGSVADKVVVIRPVAGSDIAGSDRVAEDVQTVIELALVPRREIVSCRFARVQRRATSAVADASMNAASLPVAFGA
jgi:hypothetical protein